MENMSMLAQALKNQSLIDESKIIKYEESAKEKEQTLYQYLFLNNLYTEQELILMLSKEYNYTYLNLEAYDNTHIPHIINMQWYKEFKALPIYKKENSKIGDILYVVTSNIDEIERINKKTKELYSVNIIYPILSEETSIIQLFDSIKEHSLIETKIEEKKSHPVIEKKVKEESVEVLTSNENKSEEISKTKESKEDLSLNEMLQKIILDAINSNVSDIHLEPFEENYKIRFRQNDDLYEAALPPSFISKKMTDKIKSIAKIDLNEVSIPQLGRINIKLFDGQDIDFRVSTFPTKWGEKIVMSIQNPFLTEFGLMELGFDVKQTEIIENVINENKGTILISGKNRSGKTTTSYNLLKKVNPIKNNIYALENTSTLKIKNINQIYFYPGSKISRLKSLEFLDFQDPDLIFIDDIKDEEVLPSIKLNKNKTRNIIMNLNTNSILDLFEKINEKIENIEEIFNHISLLIYQTKINKICENCKTKDSWSKQTLLSIGFTKEDVESYNKSWNTYSAIGCEKCNFKKHSGNIVVFEVLHLTEELKKEIKKSIEQKINKEDIKNYILKKTIGNIKEQILQNVKKGVITVQDASNLLNKN